MLAPVFLIFNGHAESWWPARNLLVIKQLCLVKSVGKLEQSHDTSHQIKSVCGINFMDNLVWGYLLILTSCLLHPVDTQQRREH